MKQNEIPPVHFGTCVMVYTMALAKALIPDKNLKENITPEQSDNITNFIDKVIEEVFPDTIAPMIKQSFAAELQMFQEWTKMKMRDNTQSA